MKAGTEPRSRTLEYYWIQFTILHCNLDMTQKAQLSQTPVSGSLEERRCQGREGPS